MSAAAQKELRRVDARMVRGLPGSSEAVEWLKETLAAMQQADQRPDVDLGGVEGRLAALEEALAALQRLPDLGWLQGALDDMSARLAALEARPIPEATDISDIMRRLAALESRDQPASKIDITTRNPLDHSTWSDLDSAKAALLVLVTQEAAARCGHEVTLYEQMLELDALGDARTYDQDLLWLQHQHWAQERQLVELARIQHNQAIRALPDLPAAVAYEWRVGWPEV